MQHKTSKCTLKDTGPSIPSLQRRFFSKLSPQIQDVVTPLQLERDAESMQENRAWTTLFEGGAMNSVEVTPAGGFINDSRCESKEALLLGPLGDDEDQESVDECHQKNCLALWKKLGSRHAHNRTLETLSDINIGSTRGVSAIQGNSRIMPENEAPSEEGISCGTNACSPVLSPWRCFTIEEISSATKNFHPDNIVGKGGYAKVYRGTLLNGQVIAIKKLNQSDPDEHKEKEFLVEIGIMAHVCHPNTAPLVGFCLEGGLYLIYNFYPNGSLAGILHGTRLKMFDWPLRYKVVVGTAQGLLYLHEKCRRRIIHRDIKASNILLGADFEPQISDFGLAKWLPREWTHHSVSPVEGTFGYSKHSPWIFLQDVCSIVYRMLCV